MLQSGEIPVPVLALGHQMCLLMYTAQLRRSPGQIHQSLSNGGQGFMLRALLCSSVFLRFQLPTEVLIFGLPQPKHLLHLYFTLEMGIFHWPPI